MEEVEELDRTIKDKRKNSDRQVEVTTTAPCRGGDGVFISLGHSCNRDRIV